MASAGNNEKSIIGIEVAKAVLIVNVFSPN